MTPSRYILAAALLSSLVAAAAPARIAGAPHWVGTWAAAPQMPPESTGAADPRDPGFANQTVRMIARVSLGGALVRLRFSNAYGAAAVRLGAVHVALAASGAAIVPGTDRALGFGGRPGITLPPGADVVSDPLPFAAPALARLAVTVFLPDATGPASWHSLGLQSSYIAGPGDLTAQPDLPAAQPETAWYWLSGIEVLAAPRAAAIVALGDSITDGFHSTPDANRRWPDILAEQLERRRRGAPLAVLNQGISGNRILHDLAGPNALARFDRDVLAQDGVRYLVVLEGINDIGWSHLPGGAGQAVGADDIVAGLRQMIARAHAHGILVYGGTLTPFEGAAYATPEGEAERQAVNRWIRSGGGFDRVIDFDQATCDPSHPARLRSAYDSGDHLHPNDAGYAAMGQAAAAVFQ